MKKVYIIALIAALAVAGSIFFFGRSLAEQAQIEKKPVVVAVQDIKSGTEITATMLEVKELPVDAVTSGSYNKVDAIVGQMANENIFKGEQIVKSRLGSPDEIKYDHIVQKLDPGYRAFTVAINEVTGVGCFIKAGDKVDLMYTVTLGSIVDPKDEEETTVASEEAEGAEETETSDEKTPINKNAGITQMLKQDVKVLAVGTYEQNHSEGGVSSYGTITLALPVSDVMDVVAYTHVKNSVLTLALRNPDDNSTTTYAVVPAVDENLRILPGVELEEE